MGALIKLGVSGNNKYATRERNTACPSNHKKKLSEKFVEIIKSLFVFEQSRTQCLLDYVEEGFFLLC
jgi:hypothetical protein